MYLLPNPNKYCLKKNIKKNIYTHFHWKEHDHANERLMVFRSHYALPVSTSLPGRWYYVHAAPTRLVLRQCGSYYVATRSLPRSLTGTLLLR